MYCRTLAPAAAHGRARIEMNKDVMSILCPRDNFGKKSVLKTDAPAHHARIKHACEICVAHLHAHARTATEPPEHSSAGDAQACSIQLAQHVALT